MDGASGDIDDAADEKLVEGFPNNVFTDPIQSELLDKFAAENLFLFPQAGNDAEPDVLDPLRPIVLREERCPLFEETFFSEVLQNGEGVFVFN